MQTDVDAAVAGDEAAFGALTQRHRHELQVHCYRILGSFAEAEDAVQECFLRAWRRRETYAGRAPFRAWLYRIATNVCLDALDRRPAAAGAPGAFEVPWLEPYPDHLLDLAAPEADGPDALAVARETIELAFVVAVQHLPPRQRAVLVLRDVLGWSAAEAAEVLGQSVAAANSALQRARETLRGRLPADRSAWRCGGLTAEEQDVMRRFVDATERCDVAALGALLREDAVFAMPPQPEVFVGREAIMACWAPAMVGPAAFGEWRLRTTTANRQPAVANYVRPAGADAAFEGISLDVLTVTDGAITEVITFPAAVFAAFGLPPTLPA